MAATKQFKAESKRLLDLMINSIYTHKEIFLRELISNASDAIDKYYYKSLTDPSISFDRDNFYIRLSVDQEARTISMQDTGIGMTKEELEDNLGTIARSGSLNFKSNLDEQKAKDIDIIGQFGVGFYSAFMVAKKIEVTTRSSESDSGYLWSSEGADGYTIAKCERESVGTSIKLFLKDNNEDENYDEYLEEYRLRSLITKYSDFVKYPIKMLVSKSRPKADNDKEQEEYLEDEVLNTMVPIWRKNKSELKLEDYNNFYKTKHFGYDEPLKYIHYSVDGSVSFTSLMYIPTVAPYDLFTKDYQKGLELYTNGVMIMEKCPDLLPDYFGFVKGIVDSADLSLNISRELLQHDRQLKFIAKKLKEKIKNELLSLLVDDREKYTKFFETFGRHLKYGVYDNWGAEKEVLQDLLLFACSGDKMVTLSEYVAGMPESQKYIYFASGKSVASIAKLPQTEKILDSGYAILYLTDEVDEFALNVLAKYKDKEFKSISSADIGIEETAEEKAKENDNVDLYKEMSEILKDKVSQVRASIRLKSHPVCLTAEGEISIEMEKILASMPNNPNAKAQKVLEINANHSIVEALLNAFANDKDALKEYTNLLYNQALLIEGLPIEDPVAYANSVCKLLK